MEVQSRRDFLRTVGLGALALSGCAKNYRVSQKTGNAREGYYQFVHALNEQWDGLRNSEKRKVKETWKMCDPSTKELAIRIYGNPEESYSDLTSSERGKAEKILQESKSSDFKAQEGYKEFKEMAVWFPWIKEEKLTKPDAIFMVEFGEMFGSAIMMSK